MAARTGTSNTVALIALDLDQTILGADLAVSPRVRKAIEKVHDLAVLVTIATGREARLASKFARELNIVSPIVCAQGGCIYHVANERVLHEVRLPPGLLPRIVAAARLYGWNIHFEMSDRLYFPRESNHPPALFELLRYSNWVRVGDLLRDMPEPPHKVIVTLNQTEDRARVIAEMQTSLGADLNIVASHPHLVEGLPAGVNKAHGLSWLTRYLGVDQKNVFAIGDSEADLPMLEWAGIGVAMGNGSAEVKAAADWVAPTLEEDGAAVALERFVLNRTKI